MGWGFMLKWKAKAGVFGTKSCQSHFPLAIRVNVPFTHCHRQSIMLQIDLRDESLSNAPASFLPLQSYR